MGVFAGNDTEALHTVTRGDITDFIYVRPSILDGGVIDGNWTCTTKVMRSSGGTVIQEFNVTEKSDDNTEFKVYLTGQQTQKLTTNASQVQEYVWLITLSNSVLSPENTRTLRLRLAVGNT